MRKKLSRNMLILMFRVRMISVLRKIFSKPQDTIVAYLKQAMSSAT